MSEKKPILLLASAAALTLALHQGALAETTAEAPPAAAESAQSAPAVQGAEVPTTAEGTEAPPAPESAQAPPAEGTPTPPAEQPPAVAPAPPPPPAAATAARERMEQKHEEMMEQRKRRYEDLRSRAAEVGLKLPETPPWEQTSMAPPDMPAPPGMPEPPAMPALPEMPEPPAMPAPPDAATPMPEPPMRPAARRGRMTPEARDAMREQHYQAMRERAAQQGVELPETPPWKLMSEEERTARREMMRSLTPEQRDAMREQHWQEMRERAAEKGMELPETPPWKQAQERRRERRAQWESYRKIIKDMSEEQREAAAAVFGRPEAPPRQMPRRMPTQGPYGYDYGTPRGRPQQMPQSYGMPGYGGRGGPSMYEAGPQWWGTGEAAAPPGPPPPEAGYQRPW